jgi:hypothetical protein
MCSSLAAGPFSLPMTDEQRTRIDAMVAHAKANRECTCTLIRTDPATNEPARISATLIIPCRAKLAAKLGAQL